MKSNTQILGLPTGADALLSELIHNRTGIYFDVAKTPLLLEKLSPLVIDRGFSSFFDYYCFLKYDESSRSEWLQVMNALSVGETYFWREIDQIHALTNAIIPEWVATHPNQTLRISTLACSTGEEPLTIAMALEESGWFKRISIDIQASDASTRAIEKAKCGLYRERAFRNLSPERRARFFRPEDSSTFRVRPDLQARVSYSVANIMDESEIAGPASADMVFCRNVFIYFSDKSVGRAANSFFQWMPAPGFLFVGSAESLLRLNTSFVLQEVDDAFVYIKEPHGDS